MAFAESKVLEAYVAFCPSCGQRMRFNRPYRCGDMESVQANCPCGKQWSIIFDLDLSGTFGVMSFQCDNNDRIM